LPALLQETLRRQSIDVLLFYRAKRRSSRYFADPVEGHISIFRKSSQNWICRWWSGAAHRYGGCSCAIFSVTKYHSGTHLLKTFP
jgi:hypothetical protein